MILYNKESGEQKTTKIKPLTNEHNAKTNEETIRQQSTTSPLQEVAIENNEELEFHSTDLTNIVKSKIQTLIDQFKENGKPSKFVLGEIRRFETGLNNVDKDIICCIDSSLKQYNTKVLQYFNN